MVTSVTVDAPVVHRECVAQVEVKIGVLTGDILQGLLKQGRVAKIDVDMRIRGYRERKRVCSAALAVWKECSGLVVQVDVPLCR